ncbi:MAG: dienelactone hydrolase family protein, partial [Gammaproteobacteria bacterium]
MDEAHELAGLRRYGMGRRAFATTSLIAGFTLATTRVEAQAIHTDAKGLKTGETKIPVKDGDLPAYFAHPAKGGPFPIVLVNEEVFGVHEYIKDVCRRFAKAGYMAVAAEYYARQGDITKVTSQQQLMADFIGKTPDAQYMADLDAVADWAGSHGGDLSRLGVMGFCRGGRQTWLYATHNPHLKAAVSFYGPVDGKTSPIQPKTVLDIAGDIQCPLLGLYGGKDALNPVNEVHQVEAEAKSHHKVVE